jgi:hypothetical protein
MTARGVIETCLFEQAVRAHDFAANRYPDSDWNDLNLGKGFHRRPGTPALVT